MPKKLQEAAVAAAGALAASASTLTSTAPTNPNPDANVAASAAAAGAGAGAMVNVSATDRGMIVAATSQIVGVIGRDTVLSLIAKTYQGEATAVEKGNITNDYEVDTLTHARVYFEKAAVDSCDNSEGEISNDDCKQITPYNKKVEYRQKEWVEIIEECLNHLTGDDPKVNDEYWEIEFLSFMSSGIINTEKIARACQENIASPCRDRIIQECAYRIAWENIIRMHSGSVAVKKGSNLVQVKNVWENIYRILILNGYIQIGNSLKDYIPVAKNVVATPVRRGLWFSASANAGSLGLATGETNMAPLEPIKKK